MHAGADDGSRHHTDGLLAILSVDLREARLRGFNEGVLDRGQRLEATFAPLGALTVEQLGEDPVVAGKSARQSLTERADD